MTNSSINVYLNTWNVREEKECPTVADEAALRGFAADDDDSPPTSEDLEALPRVADKIPYTIFIVVAAEAAERFTYRSLTGPMREYGVHSGDEP